MSDGEKAPNLNDYLAGAMLANGFVWIWAQVLPYLSWIPFALLAWVSYFIYLSGGIVASYLVCKRTTSGHLAVGLKVAAVAWAFSILLMLSFATEPTVGLAIALLICFAAGGVAGAYLTLRSRLRSLRVKYEAESV